MQNDREQRASEVEDFLQTSALNRRLASRWARPAGVIDVRHAEALYARTALWAARKFELVGQLLSRYGVAEQLRPGGDPLVFEQTPGDVPPADLGAAIRPKDSDARLSVERATASESRRAPTAGEAQARAPSPAANLPPATPATFRVSRRPAPITPRTDPTAPAVPPRDAAGPDLRAPEAGRAHDAPSDAPQREPGRQASAPTARPARDILDGEDSHTSPAGRATAREIRRSALDDGAASGEEPTMPPLQPRPASRSAEGHIAASAGASRALVNPLPTAPEIVPARAPAVTKATPVLAGSEPRPAAMANEDDPPSVGVPSRGVKARPVLAVAAEIRAANDSQIGATLVLPENSENAAARGRNSTSRAGARVAASQQQGNDTAGESGAGRVRTAAAQPSPPSAGEAAVVDIGRITRQVVRSIARRAAVERERRGIGR